MFCYHRLSNGFGVVFIFKELSSFKYLSRNQALKKYLLLKRFGDHKNVFFFSENRSSIYYEATYFTENYNVGYSCDGQA